MLKKLSNEYKAVCSLLHRSGLHNIKQLTNYEQNRNVHTSSVRNQKTPDLDPNKKPNKDDEDDNKVSSLLAKAFLWMLTAYMVIAIISLLFPSSNQPEVIF